MKQPRQRMFRSLLAAGVFGAVAGIAQMVAAQQAPATPDAPLLSDDTIPLDGKALAARIGMDVLRLDMNGTYLARMQAAPVPQNDADAQKIMLDVTRLSGVDIQKLIAKHRRAFRDFSILSGHGAHTVRQTGLPSAQVLSFLASNAPGEAWVLQNPRGGKLCVMDTVDPDTTNVEYYTSPVLGTWISAYSCVLPQSMRAMDGAVIYPQAFTRAVADYMALGRTEEDVQAHILFDNPNYMTTYYFDMAGVPEAERTQDLYTQTEQRLSDFMAQDRGDVEKYNAYMVDVARTTKGPEAFLALLTLRQLNLPNPAQAASLAGLRLKDVAGSPASMRPYRMNDRRAALTPGQIPGQNPALSLLRYRA